MSVAWVGVAATVAGAALSANASSKASKAQQQSASDANQLSQEQFDKQIALQEPFRQTGVAANSKLAYLMGLTTPQSGTYTANTPSTLVQQADGTYAVSTQPQAPAIDRNALRSELLSQYTRTTPGSPGTEMFNGENTGAGAIIGYSAPTSSVDEAGLNAEIDRRIAAQAAQAQAQAQGSQQQSSDSTVNADGTPASIPMDQGRGSLLRNFTTADLNADPVYQSGLQFGLNEGVKGIDRQQGATGSRLSGATLKALTRYGNDYGSTKASDSRNRFKDDQNSIYNKLAGVSGAGQQATNQIGSSSQNYASTVGANMMSAGNARAAGYVGGANAVNGGIGSGINQWQNNNLMNKIFPSGGSSSFSNTSVGSSGFGTGLAYGNQDYGAFI